MDYLIYCKNSCILCIATNTRHEFLRILFAPSSKLNTIRARCTSSANHFSQLVHRTLSKRLLLKQVPQLVCERPDKAVSSTYSIHYLHLRTGNSFSLNGMHTQFPTSVPLPMNAPSPPSVIITTNPGFIWVIASIISALLQCSLPVMIWLSVSLGTKISTLSSRTWDEAGAGFKMVTISEGHRHA